MGSWLERNRGIVVTFLATVIVVGLVTLVLQRRGGPQSLEIRFDDPALGGASIGVYVSGAVQKPGVYPLHEGDRIEDALAAAGGPTDDADTSSLNLALRLRDQDRVSVPRVGEVAGATAIAVKVNLNTATAEELDRMPGIGEVYSKKIVESRESVGQFHRIEELVERQLVPESTLERIKDLITVSP